MGSRTRMSELKNKMRILVLSYGIIMNNAGLNNFIRCLQAPRCSDPLENITI